MKIKRKLSPVGYITGATGRSYVPVATDAGEHTLRVAVTAVNSGGSLKVESAATAAVAP